MKRLFLPSIASTFFVATGLGAHSVVDDYASLPHLERRFHQESTQAPSEGPDAPIAYSNHFPTPPPAREQGEIPSADTLFFYMEQRQSTPTQEIADNTPTQSAPPPPDELAKQEEETPAAELKISDEDLLVKARTLVDQKKLDDAIGLYEEIVTRHPDNVAYLMELGKLYMRLDRKPEAIALYERALKIDPGNVEVETALAYAYLFDEELEKSRDLFLEILKADPANTDALAGLGNLAVYEEKWAEAQTYYSRALEIDPQNYTTLLYLGNLRLRQYRYRDAKDLFAQLLCRNPDDPDVQQGLVFALRELLALPENPSDLSDTELYDSAEKYVALNQIDLAISYYQELLHRHPDDIDYLLALGKLKVRSNKYYDAIELYNHALGIDAGNQDILLALGFAYLFAKEYESSMKAFQEVLEQAPDNAEALAGMGYVAASEGKIDDAETYYAKALAIDPSNYTALVYLGNLRLQQQRFEEAKAIFVKLMGIEPNDPDVEEGLINALQLRLARNGDIKELSDEDLKTEAERLAAANNTARAMALYEMLLERHPNDPIVLLSIGRLNSSAGNFSDAINRYKQALLLQPDNQEALTALAFAFLFSNDYSSSQATFEKLLNLNPKNADALAGLGNIALLNGNLAQAEQYLNQAIAINPYHSTALIYLGNVKLRQKRYQEAKVIFAKLMCREPNNPDVQQGLLSALQNILAAAEEPDNAAPKEPEQGPSENLAPPPSLPTPEIPSENAEAPESNKPERPNISTQLQLDKESPTVGAAPTIPEGAPNDATTPLGPKPVQPDIKTAKEITPNISRQQQLANETPNDIGTSNNQKQLRAAKEAPIEKTEGLLQLGRSYLSDEKTYEALEILKSAFAADPSSIETRFWLGLAYLNANSLPASQELLTGAYDDDPENPEILAALGLLATKQKNISLAEKRLLQALRIDPKNPSALQYLAELRLQQERYDDAHDLYGRLATLESDNPSLEKGLADVRDKPILDAAKRYQTEGRYAWALDEYQKLLANTPDNVDYLVKIAMLYRSLDRINDAIATYTTALQMDPDRNDIRTALAFALLANKQYSQANVLFDNVLHQEPNNSEALAGLGRLATLVGDGEAAEHYLRKALSLEPENLTATEFLALLRMKQKRYSEAQQLYQWLVGRDKDNTDYWTGLRDALDQPLLARARQLESEGDYIGAAGLYQELIAYSPQNADYYLLLGRAYVSLERTCDAINVYSEGLDLRPCDIDLLRAMAFAYLYRALEIDSLEGRFSFHLWYPFITCSCKENIRMSEELFLQVLVQNPNDPDALAGLGRVFLLKGCQNAAEELYQEALAAEPGNETALTYLGGLWLLQGRGFSARDTFGYLLSNHPDDSDLCNTYILARKASELVFTTRGFYGEENEKDFVTPTTKEWTARLHDYFGELAWVYPVNDCLKLSGGVIDEYIILNDLLNKTRIYSLDIQRGNLGFSWNYCPYVTVYGSLGASFYDQYHCSTYRCNRGWYFEPALGMNFARDYHSLTLETVSDSPIVARNFTNNKATLIERQLLRGIYEYDFGKRRTVGMSGSYVWYYNNIKNDQAQFLSAWIQWTPCCFWENFYVRYQFDYGRFNDLIDNYYTFQDQTTHWIKLELTKNWCDDTVTTTAGYWHGWQRSFEQGQIILINPLIPFHFVHREIDAAYGRLNVILNCHLDLGVIGTYSKDTFDYTTASVTGTINWRF